MLVESIESKSKQIFPDAADFGAPTRKGDAVWNAAKQLVDWYGVEGTRIEQRYPTGTTVSQVIEYMPNEHESDEYIKVVVEYTTTRNHPSMDGYVTVYLQQQ